MRTFGVHLSNRAILWLDNQNQNLHESWTRICIKRSLSALTVLIFELFRTQQITERLNFQICWWEEGGARVSLAPLGPYSEGTQSGWTYCILSKLASCAIAPERPLVPSPTESSLTHLAGLHGSRHFLKKRQVESKSDKEVFKIIPKKYLTADSQNIRTYLHEIKH